MLLALRVSVKLSLTGMVTVDECRPSAAAAAATACGLQVEGCNLPVAGTGLRRRTGSKQGIGWQFSE